MKKVCRFCMVYYKCNIKFGMYMVSLLFNLKFIDEVIEILYDIVVIF